MNKQTYQVNIENAGVRLDVFLSEAMQATRSKATNLIKFDKVTLNGVIVKAGTIVKEKDVIEVALEEKITELLGEDIPLDVLFEDDTILVINKPAGLTVHPGGGADSGTLANALIFRGISLSSVSGVERPGIVHRLDKDTTGVMVIAKTDAAHVSLSSQFEKRTVTKKYLGIVEGVIKRDSGEVTKKIGRDIKNGKLMAVVGYGGKEAITLYKVLERYNANTLVEFKILTGRTHQIRVHAKYLGHPVVGDVNYGYKKQRFNVSGQLLHASTIEFEHPKTNKRLSFTAPNPNDFERILKVLKSENKDK